MAQFSLSWDAYKQNICHGLSALQQNGEFVDMTIAADGHHVKVHQMVMSLVSPYLKELITSAPCPHPVIFLNKISYTVLCAILEYIYTGEVMVDKDHLQDLVDAGRELHIKGLEDMKIELSNKQSSQTILAQRNEGQPLSETGYFEKQVTENQYDNAMTTRKRKLQATLSRQSVKVDNADLSDFGDDHQTYDEPNESIEDSVKNSSYINVSKTDDGKPLGVPSTPIQYTLSNQGALQMVLNRYIYYLRYTRKRDQHGCVRRWKCVNKQKQRQQCPAEVMTLNEVVTKRYGVHNHPFHDKQILRKARDNAIFTKINEAERSGKQKKIENRQEHPPKKAKTQGDGDTTTDAE